MVIILGFHPRDPGSIPGMDDVLVAQLEERTALDGVVVGSIPTWDIFVRWCKWSARLDLFLGYLGSSPS
jgi:hypothetical protein